MSFEGFARLYAAAAIMFVALSFFPVMDDEAEVYAYGNQGGAFGGLLDAGGPGVSLSGERTVALLVLVGMLLIAAFSTAPGIAGLGWGIAGFAALFVVLIVLGPKTDEVDVSLTQAGQASVAVVALTAVTGVVHEVRLVRHGRRRLPDR